MNSIGIIPARYASSRFPGKPLVEIAGMTMIERVYRQCQKSKKLSQIIVATDDQRIFDCVKSFGGNAQMTSTTHKNGTARIGEIIENKNDFDLIVNIQGDEPFIDPTEIDFLIENMSKSGTDIGTLAKKIDDSAELFNPNTVKVIFNQNNKALYFSRNPIPYLANIEKEDWLENFSFYKHIGLYAYSSDAFRRILALPISPLAKAESLEQLTWLEAEMDIEICITKSESQGIDTPDDLQNILQKKGLT